MVNQVVIGQKAPDVAGISANDPESHEHFHDTYKFPFMLLIFVINREGIVLYRYVEPTRLTRRKADELVAMLRDLKAKGKI